MNNTYFVSDTHFGHFNVIKYSNRPFNNVDEMNESMINNWNQVVKPGDTVYHLGDFAFAKDYEIINILNSLNGQKHFIYGNHDKPIKNNPKKFIGGKLFQSISDYKEISIGEQKVIMFHYGMRVWNKSHYGSYMLHGHSHGSLPPFGKSVDVGVDATFITGKAEYRPISYDEIKFFMDKQVFVKVDHHEE